MHVSILVEKSFMGWWVSYHIILQVNNGSIAERHGLKAGDAVLQINGANSHDLTHDDAKYNILRSGNSLNLLLQR